MSASEIDAEILKELERIPLFTEKDQASLVEAAKSLESDPKFHADYVKARFVEDVHEAMDEDGLSQADLARRWGRSRQFLSNLLNEDRRINFSIETMVALGLVLGRKVEIRMIKPQKPSFVVSTFEPLRPFDAMDTWGGVSGRQARAFYDTGFKASTTRINFDIDESTRLSS